MDKKGNLSRRDVASLKKYTNHLKAMKTDLKTEQDVLDEFEWLTENGFCFKVKEGVYDKTKKGKELDKILDSLKQEKR